MFNFEVLHTPGKLNPADPASRRPDYVSGKHLDGKVVLLGFCTAHADSADICALSMTSAPQINKDVSFIPTDTFTLHCSKELYTSNPFVLNGSKRFLTFEGGLWWWRDCLYVPPSFRQYLMERFHGDPASGHWGIF